MTAIHLTEYHPTLFNNEGHKPDRSGGMENGTRVTR